MTPSPERRGLAVDDVDQLQLGGRAGHGHGQQPIRIVALEQDANQPSGFRAPAADAMAWRKAVTSAPSGS